jgi:probable F420-dependent oxidoreductase
MAVMRIGIVSPVVTRVPGAHDAWEDTAGIEELSRIAADRLGFHHLTCSEHVAVPASEAARRGATYWDPLATFGYLAAVTSQIRLVTQVLVLGYHHPLAIAKRYGTLDRISGGRLVLGVGVGSLREEFDLLGAAFDDRGRRADDALGALRAALSRREPEYHGAYVDFAGLVVEPHAVQERVPLWVGGRSGRSLRRALELGDGWVPFGLRTDELRTMLEAATRTIERPAGFEVVLSAGRPLDPLADPDGVRRRLETVESAGATIVGASIRAGSMEHYLDQLGALADLAAHRSRPGEGDAR